MNGKRKTQRIPRLSLALLLVLLVGSLPMQGSGVLLRALDFEEAMNGDTATELTTEAEEVAEPLALVMAPGARIDSELSADLSDDALDDDEEAVAPESKVNVESEPASTAEPVVGIEANKNETSKESKIAFNAINQSVIPDPVSELRARNTQNGNIELQWGGARDADYYAVFALGTTGREVSFRSFIRDTRWIDTEAVPGAYNFYTVLAAHQDAPGKFSFSAMPVPGYCFAFSQSMNLPGPQNLRARGIQDGAIGLSWDRLSGARGYVVCYLGLHGMEERRLAELGQDETCYVHRDPEPGAMNFYRVLGIYDVQGTEYLSERPQPSYVYAQPGQTSSHGGDDGGSPAPGMPERPDTPETPDAPGNSDGLSIREQHYLEIILDSTQEHYGHRPDRSQVRFMDLWVPAQETSTYCAMACTQAILDWYGIERSQSQLARELGYVAGYGADNAPVLKGLNHILAEAGKEELHYRLAPIDESTYTRQYFDGVVRQAVEKRRPLMPIVRMSELYPQIGPYTHNVLCTGWIAARDSEKTIDYLVLQDPFGPLWTKYKGLKVMPFHQVLEAIQASPEPEYFY